MRLSIPNQAPIQLDPGITPAGTGVSDVVWNILGHTYYLKAESVNAFAFETVDPPGTYVPVHIHPTQDEFIYVLDGRFDLLLDGAPASAGPGDLIRLPRGIPHGIFNKTGTDVSCLFWVAPTGRLWELFVAIDGVPDPAEVVRLAALHEVDFLPPP